MANPNNVIKYASRKMNLLKEVGFNDENEAIKAVEEFKALGIYDVVKKTSFRIGPKPTSANGIRQMYSYMVRCYTKNN